jgi:hypothetical protein
VGDDATENKFGFDKVIVCCDVDNIKKIFKNRYGSDVDFNGYIDKFYTSHIYYFNNKATICNIIEDVVRSFKITDVQSPAFKTKYFEFFRNILFSMVYSGTLNLRLLKNWRGKRFALEQLPSNIGTCSVTVESLHIVQLFSVLIKMFNNIDALMEALNKTTFFPIRKYSECKGALADLVLLASYKKHFFKNGTGESIDYETDYYKYSVNFFNEGFCYGIITNMQEISSGEILSKKSDYEFSVYFTDLLRNALKVYRSGL